MVLQINILTALNNVENSKVLIVCRVKILDKQKGVGSNQNQNFIQLFNTDEK